MKIVLIDIDNLVVDDFNIRKTISAGDVNPMVKSIKEQGIIQNLVVRPAKDFGENMYSIICGSRRYRAAIKADLEELPCKLINVDDITAMGISLQENEGRLDIPPWRTIDWIGEMADKIKVKKKIRNGKRLIDELVRKSMSSRQTVNKYLKINKLPQKVKMLLKPHDERRLEENEMIKKYIPYGYIKPELTIGVAELIANNLSRLPEEQLFVHSLELSDYSYNKAKEIIDVLKKNPNKSIEEINELIVSDSNTRVKTITFEKNLYEKLKDMTVKRKKKLDELIIALIKEGLKYY